MVLQPKHFGVHDLEYYDNGPSVILVERFWEIPKIKLNQTFLE
jgi:hypothetical protein